MCLFGCNNRSGCNGGSDCNRRNECGRSCGSVFGRGLFCRRDCDERCDRRERENRSGLRDSSDSCDC